MSVKALITVALYVIGAEPLHMLEEAPSVNTGIPRVAYTEATTGFMSKQPDARVPFI